MSKLLVIYNLCGISGREDINLYKQCIDAVLSQNYSDYHLCLSSCLNSEAIRNDLMTTFGHKVSYDFIDDRVPVNVSFNHAIRKCEEINKYDGFLYLASDVELEDRETFRKLNEQISNKYGMITIQVDQDNSFNNYLNTSEHYVIKPGQAVNNHCTWFSRSILDYYGNTEPDIFAGYCSESVFVYVNAAIKKQWLLLGNVRATHHRNRNDGATSGFCHRGPNNNAWDNLFNAPRKMVDIIADEDAAKSGFGYEECHQVRTHDPEQFDENYHCKNELLKEFIKKNIYLQKENFDYDTIKARFIE